MQPLTQFEKMRANRRKSEQFMACAELLKMRPGPVVGGQSLVYANGEAVPVARTSSQPHWLKKWEWQ